MRCALQAQTAVLRALLDRDNPATPPAVLWVLEKQGDPALSDGFAALLPSPELRVYQVPFKAIPVETAEGRGLLARHRLPLASQWLMLDARTGALLAHGGAVPKAGAFAQLLVQAGFRDRVKELRAFLKRNPNSLEARDQLLAAIRGRSEAVAMSFLGVRLESPRERGDLAQASAPQPRPDLRTAKPLTAVQDLEAWSAFTQELDTDFSSGRWRELDMAWIGEARPLDAASPTLQGLYVRWLPEVEGALREDPASEGLWALWGWMAEASGGRRLRPLLASLSPSPLTPRSEWPPKTAARMLLASAKTPEDWQALKAHYQAAWEEGFHPLLQRAVEKTTFPWESDWADSLSPLVECCLRGGAPDQADAYVRGALDASRWPGLPAQASALAARCGNAALAARWAASKPAR